MSRTTSSAVPETLKDNIKEYFLSNPVSLRQCAEQSVRLFGVLVDYETLRSIANKEKWSYEKQLKVVGEAAGDRKKQIENILDKAYGLLMTEQLLANPSAWASIANTYFTGMSKMGGSVGDISHKTDIQKILEEASKELEISG